MIKKNKIIGTSFSLMILALLIGCTGKNIPESSRIDRKAILATYANIANENYKDALQDAKYLQKTIKKFTDNPTKITFNNAKDAWLVSRESYGQTEIFRLANGPIDAEQGWVAEKYGNLEGQLNAWPLDESMIDYTIDDQGSKTFGNIIDTKGKFNPGGEGSTIIDTSTINIEVITKLNENGGDANVASGYHAVEFLLWGQDQDYSNFIKDSITNGDLMAGQRPLSDYTTAKNSNRRKDYLNALVKKIVADLKVIASAWEIDADYRTAFLNNNNDERKNINSKLAMKTILSAMGTFIKSELANERIAIAVLTPSEEDEHSCFSDNTHRDIVANYQGFKNILTGSYKNKKIGISPIDAMNIKEKNSILSLMKKIEIKISSIDKIAKTSRHFDKQIQSRDPQSKIIIKLKNELRKLGDKMILVARANNINLLVDDITDEEETKL